MATQEAQRNQDINEKGPLYYFFPPSHPPVLTFVFLLSHSCVYVYKYVCGGQGNLGIIFQVSLTSTLAPLFYTESLAGLDL